MIKSIIFDLDGTLIDTEENMWGFNYIQVLNSWGLKASKKDLKGLFGGPREKAVKELKDLYGEDFDDKKFFEEVTKLNQKFIEEKRFKLLPGVLDVLKFCRHNNIEAILATNGDAKTVFKVLNDLKIDVYFNRVITGNDNIPKKPDPTLFNLAALNRNKDETIIIEDSASGVNGGFNSGIKTILIPNVGEVSKEDMLKVFKTYAQINQIIPLLT